MARACPAIEPPPPPGDEAKTSVDENRWTQCVEFAPARAPVGHVTVHQAFESGAMVVVLQMRELVHDHVVDQVEGCFDELGVQRDGAGRGATAPL